ncbi:hypothetical protein [Bradyrhizobium erythrophlei]|uniref:Uncharacterized protein n=1 Tax=Bradyrhizobium erythrophlei TaxID=1437360 RepID=A0A1M5TB61_9BRAD|nr:hypothetical protein [Bradyrhizobium erythrophlei]SHH47583.1 hypothetical protein SAMN05444169_7640 [Bradyrhizobium erythrophlei]
MLHQPVTAYDFAKYSYKPDTEVTMGYEYENTVPGRRTYTMTEEQRNSKLARDLVSQLPLYFKVEYEGFGAASGCEIKSVVAPLFLHKQFWLKKVSKIAFHMEENNNQTNDSGIHVSVSRTPFTTAQQTKVFGFLHDPANRPLFFKMSRRTTQSFNTNCPSNPKGNTYWDGRAYKYVHHEPPHWNDHYNMINTENRERYEFRLFAAHPTLLLPALEMCDSLFKFADIVDQITFPTWRAYIARFKKYQHIKEHCIATLDHSPS